MYRTLFNYSCIELLRYPVQPVLRNIYDIAPLTITFTKPLHTFTIDIRRSYGGITLRIDIFPKDPNIHEKHLHIVNVSLLLQTLCDKLLVNVIVNVPYGLAQPCYR